MAEYIDGEYIEDLPDKESLDDSDFFIAEDSEATKKTTFGTLKNYIRDKATGYFGISSNASDPPTHDSANSSILGIGILGQMLLGDSATWTVEFPTDLYSDAYVWVSYYIEHPDGTDEWSTPFCLMDQNVKNSILDIQSVLGTKADQTDAEENAKEITSLSEELGKVISAIKKLQEEICELKKTIGSTDISDMGDGSLTGAIDYAKYGRLGPDEN